MQAAMPLTDLVPRPDPKTINTHTGSCPTGLLVQRFGPPRHILTDDCEPVTSKYWKSKMKTADVGPFRATGHHLALQLLTEAFKAVEQDNPELFDALGSAGMLCCRRVRGSKSTLSNHGLGMAIDVTINGKLDHRGDGKVMIGTLELYSILKRFGFYWGAGFHTEDGMHFEVGSKKIRDWIDGGLM